LLFANLAIVVPGLVAGSLAAVVEFALEPTPAAALDAGLWTRLVEGLAQIVASILSIAYTTGMAEAAWETGRARFGDGARAFRRDGGHVFVAMLVLFAFGFVAAVLAPFTLGLSLAAYLFFFIYTMAAASGADAARGRGRASDRVCYRRRGLTAGGRAADRAARGRGGRAGGDRLRRARDRGRVPRAAQ
jgi:hypothetical protein